jgi:proline iminopeptidase
MRDLYPPIEPFRTCGIEVSGGHWLFVEESGNPNGLPVVFLHGGPGSGCTPRQRRFFDPERYRIVLFDQRGCGRSTPRGSLEANTTSDLVADLEAIRTQLGIERWVVFGGSWGSTLALAYAQAHPARVLALVLRGIFMIRPSEIRWFYQDGASHLFPDAWDQFLAPIPEAERGDLLAAYHRRLTGDGPDERRQTAIAWATWEASTSYHTPDDDQVAAFADPEHADAVARIEAHYFVNGAFLGFPDALLDGVERIRHIPAWIVQGRYDLVCPMATAWDLHRRWPEASFEIVADAGHSAFETGTVDRLVVATDKIAARLGGAR